MARLIFILSLIFLVIAVSEAREIAVGGKESKTFWRVSGGNHTNLNYWAEKQRFSAGDVLVWNFDAEKESVLEVTKKAYKSCDKTNPINELKDGGKLTLDRSGPFYFISGDESHCKKGLKLEVVVLSAHRQVLFPPAPAPAPSASSASGAGLYGSLTMAAVAAIFSMLLI
ncbi:Early nodulin-like protein 1 [Linum perenne]